MRIFLCVSSVYPNVMGISFALKQFLKDVDVKEALELQIFQFSQTLKG